MTTKEKMTTKERIKRKLVHGPVHQGLASKRTEQFGTTSWTERALFSVVVVICVKRVRKL
jgi:hypothetical protein